MRRFSTHFLTRRLIGGSLAAIRVTTTRQELPNLQEAYKLTRITSLVEDSHQDNLLMRVEKLKETFPLLRDSSFRGIVYVASVAFSSLFIISCTLSFSVFLSVSAHTFDLSFILPILYFRSLYLSYQIFFSCLALFFISLSGSITAAKKFDPFNSHLVSKMKPHLR